MAAIKVFERKPSDRKKDKKYNCLILAHGAGAPADSMFMERLSGFLALAGIATVRFEFPYMQRTRDDGRKRPPDRQPVLLEHFREVIRQVAGSLESLDSLERGQIFIGGKSMGGRMASLLAAEPDLADTVSGCVCFGYPFHPPGKPDRWRVEHFGHFCCPVMIIQGTRDPFGKKSEVEDCKALSGKDCRIHWLEGANHDFKPLAKQPETQDRMIENAANAASEFIAQVY